MINWQRPSSTKIDLFKDSLGPFRQHFGNTFGMRPCYLGQLSGPILRVKRPVPRSNLHLNYRGNPFFSHWNIFKSCKSLISLSLPVPPLFCEKKQPSCLCCLWYITLRPWQANLAPRILTIAKGIWATKMVVSFGYNDWYNGDRWIWLN